jgi:hypothetical protein
MLSKSEFDKVIKFCAIAGTGVAMAALTFYAMPLIYALPGSGLIGAGLYVGGKIVNNIYDDGEPDLANAAGHLENVKNEKDNTYFKMNSKKISSGDSVVIHSHNSGISAKQLKCLGNERTPG